MELIEGESLRDRLRREGSLELNTAISIAKQITEGVGALHAAGIIHRDLKPENIMLVNDGSIEVLDFGVPGFEICDQLIAAGEDRQTDVRSSDQGLKTDTAGLSIHGVTSIIVTRPPGLLAEQCVLHDAFSGAMGRMTSTAWQGLSVRCP